MKNYVKPVYFFLTYFIFIAFPFYGNTYSQESVKQYPNLENVISKGNLLLGIKQHIGNDDKGSLDSQVLNFESSKQIITLKSANGIIHKSKNFKILWSESILKNPEISEKYVLGPFPSFESAKKQSDLIKNKGLKPIITFPNDWEIWLSADSKLNNEDNFTFETKVIRRKISPHLSGDKFNKKLQGPIHISSDSPIKINDVEYGKNFYIISDSYGTWTLVQEISFKQYLKGVLPHEMGSNSPLEALKAQAVIARTWALYNSGRFKADNYHLCITTQCQVYKPIHNSNKKIIEAIENTSNLVLTFENNLVNAFYHASNGGISANSNEAWDMKDYPYFLPRFDKKTLNILLGNNMRDQMKLDYFLDHPIEDFYGHRHYLFRWEKKISSHQIEDALSSHELFKNNKKISTIKAIKRSISGRVVELEIRQGNSNDRIILSKDNIRRYLRFLPSNLFIIDKLNDNFWVFRGGGFGHGVGLSQSSAIEMAESGLTFEKILAHYYQNTELKKIYNLSR